MTTVKKWLWGIGAALILLTVAYCSGRQAGARQVYAKIAHDSAEHLAHVLKASARTLDTLHRATVAAARVDSTARAVHARARRRIRIDSDSQVTLVEPVLVPNDHRGFDTSVVAGPTLSVPPIMVTELRTSDARHAADSKLIAKQAAELAELWRRDTLHTARERNLETELALAKPPPCGRKCGFVLGAAVSYAATSPGQIVKAAVWVVRVVGTVARRK